MIELYCVLGTIKVAKGRLFTTPGKASRDSRVDQTLINGQGLRLQNNFCDRIQIPSSRHAMRYKVG